VIRSGQRCSGLAFLVTLPGRLRCLAAATVVCWITDHYQPCSNLGVDISEGCFIFDLTSLALEAIKGWPWDGGSHTNTVVVVVVVVALLPWLSPEMFEKIKYMVHSRPLFRQNQIADRFSANKIGDERL